MGAHTTQLQKALQAYIVAGITALIALNVWYVRQINDHEKRLSIIEEREKGGRIVRNDLDILRLQIFQEMGNKVDARLEALMRSIQDMHGQVRMKTNYYNTTHGGLNPGDDWSR